MKLRKGDLVEYGLDKLGGRVEAVVRRVHRDGTVTVEARFFLNANDEVRGGYLGYKYRYRAATLRRVLSPRSPKASELRAQR